VSLQTVVFGIVGAALMLAVVFELVRRRRLRIGYSLLWLLIGGVALVLILFRDILGLLAQLIGVQSPTSLLFTAGIACAFLILLEHSLTLTILWRQNKSLAQSQALLEWQIRKLQDQLEASQIGNPWLEPGLTADEFLQREGIPHWALLALPPDALDSWHRSEELAIKSESLQLATAPLKGLNPWLEEVSYD
jgi:hypothetical protein